MINLQPFMIRLFRWQGTLQITSGIRYLMFVCFWRDSPQWATASSFRRFLDHTQRRSTVGRTPLDEWSARSRDLYLTTHNTNNRQTSMPAVGFEPTILAGERPQTYTLDRAATGTGKIFNVFSGITLYIENSSSPRFRLNQIRFFRQNTKFFPLGVTRGFAGGFYVHKREPAESQC